MVDYSTINKTHGGIVWLSVPIFFKVNKTIKTLNGSSHIQMDHPTYKMGPLLVINGGITTPINGLIKKWLSLGLFHSPPPL